MNTYKEKEDNLIGGIGFIPATEFNALKTEYEQLKPKAEQTKRLSIAITNTVERQRIRLKDQEVLIQNKDDQLLVLESKLQ